MSYVSWFLDSPLVYRLGSALVHFLWQGAIVAVALSVAMWLLRRRSASTRYIASWIALVAMAACVPVTVWVSDAPPAMSDSAADVEAMALSEPLPQDPEGAVGGGSQDVSAVDADERDIGVRDAGERYEADTAAGTLAVGQVDPADFPFESHWKWWSRALPWIVGCWLVGAVGLSLWRAGGWLHLRRICRVGTRAASHDTSQAFERLLERLRVSRPVRLLESTLARSPVVIGWLRPVVLLPVTIVAELPPRQLEMILAHELAHVRRWDFLWNLIQTVIETLLFYHPAVWWVSRQIRAEREACCDEMAATVMGDRLLYAQSLASLEEMRHERNQQLGSSLQVAADNGMLLGRIRRVLGLPNENRRAGYGWLGGILAVSLVAATLAGYMATADEPAERSEATISDEAGKRAASNEQSPTSPPSTVSSGEAKDSIRMETSPSEPAVGPNDDQPAADTELIEKYAGTVTDERGRPLEGVTVKMCGVERFHDGRWHRNGRPDCLVPRPTESDETGRFVVEFTEAAFDMPFDEKKTRVNLWFDKEGYAPTYLPGVFPKPQDTTVVLRRGIRVSGTVKRQTNGQLTPIQGAVVYLQCSSGDLAHQKRVFDDPYFFLLKRMEGEEGCDLPYRQRVLTDADGRYTVTLSPPPKGKRWFLVCSDEAWHKDSAWRGPKLVKGVISDVKDGQPTNGPDFIVGAKVDETGDREDDPAAATSTQTPERREPKADHKPGVGRLHWSVSYEGGLVMKADGSDAEPIQLGMCFSNMTGQPVKVDAYAPFLRHAFLEVTGPDEESVVKVPHDVLLSLPGPDRTGSEFPTLRHGHAYDHPQRWAFPGVFLDPSAETWKLVRYQLKKPGKYHLRFRYVNLAPMVNRDIESGTAKWSKDCWAGELVGNEFDVWVAANYGPVETEDEARKKAREKVTALASEGRIRASDLNIKSLGKARIEKRGEIPLDVLPGEKMNLNGELRVVPRHVPQYFGPDVWFFHCQSDPTEGYVCIDALTGNVFWIQVRPPIPVLDEGMPSADGPLTGIGPGEAEAGRPAGGLQCRLRTTKRIWKVGEPLEFEADIWNSGAKEWTRPTDPLKRYRVEVDGQWYGWVGQVGIEPGKRFPQASIGKQPETLSIEVDWAWWDDAGQWLKCLPGKHTVRVGIPVQPADADGAEPTRVVSNPVRIEIVTEDDPVPKTPWGPAAEGVQMRLRADQRTWRHGETPTLLSDVRNRGTRELHLWRHQALCELEFDGRWYEWARAEGSFKSSWFPPGREYFGISFNLLDNWQSKTDKKPLALTAGQHKVRVAIVARSPNAKDRNKLPPIRSVSNEATIEILPPPKEREQIDGNASVRDKDDTPSLETSSPDAQLEERLNRLYAATEQAFEDVGLSEEDVKAVLAVQAPPQKLWKPYGEAWPAIREARERAAREMADLGPDVVPLLLRAKDESWGGTNRGDLFVDAIEKIGKLAVPHTIEALSGQDRQVRARAITALGRIGDTRAVDPIIRLLDEPDAGIVRSALWAFGRLRDNRAVDPLLRLWDKGEFRRETAMALGAIGDKRAVQPIITALDECVGEAKETGNWHQQDMTMLRYIGALRQLGDPKAIPLLKRLLESGPHPQRTKVGAKYMLAEEAANALRSLGFQVEGDIDEGGYRIVVEKMPSWQMDVEEFLEHMSRVAKGWSQQRLLDYAGQPLAKSEDGWLYKSYVSPVAGGEYLSFRFRMVNGVVTEIYRTQGSVSAAPVQD